MDDSDSTLIYFFAVLIGLLISGVIGSWIARQRGRKPGEGFCLGFFLGPIGLIVEGLLPQIGKLMPGDDRPRRKCPFCAELVLPEAVICKHCGRELPAVPPPAPQPVPPPVLSKWRRMTTGERILLFAILAVVLAAMIIASIYNK